MSWAHKGDSPVKALDPNTAWLVAGTWLFGTTASAAVILGFIFYRWAPSKVILLSIITGVGAAVLMTAFQPRYSAKLNRPHVNLGMRLSALREAIEHAAGAKTAQDAENRFREKLSRIIPERAVPGGYTVSRTAKRLEISTYDKYGGRSTTILPRH